MVRGGRLIGSKPYFVNSYGDICHFTVSRNKTCERELKLIGRGLSGVYSCHQENYFTDLAGSGIFMSLLIIV